MGLSTTSVGKVAAAVQELTEGNAPVLWLEGQACSGCSVSLLNSYPLTPDKLFTRNINLKFHQTLSTAQGDVAVNCVNETIQQKDYILIVEGSIPVGMPEACRFAHENFTDQLRRAIPNAKACIAVGACSSYGGVPAAEGNPTGATSLRKFMEQEGFDQPLVVVPGCPPHPDWMVGTIVHLLKFGMPELDDDLRPKTFFAKTIHDQCPRFADYEREHFAMDFTEDGCLFKLGCQGPVTYADCTVRKWNSGVNDCIESNGGCVGCASEDFPRKKRLPFYTLDTDREVY